MRFLPHVVIRDGPVAADQEGSSVVPLTEAGFAQGAQVWNMPSYRPTLVNQIDNFASRLIPNPADQNPWPDAIVRAGVGTRPTSLPRIGYPHRDLV